MGKRTSLSGNVAPPAKAAKAAKAARKIATGSASPVPVDYGAAETVSYSLPVEIIDEIAELASLRMHFEKLERRAAQAAGEPRGARPQVRRSASAIVREALYAHRGAVLAEIAELTDSKDKA